MNCSKLATVTGWDCTASGDRSVRAVAPIPLGDGGQHIAFYIAQPSDRTFFLTDACETAMHAEQLGMMLNKNRLDALNRTYGVGCAQFQNDWSIEASGFIEDLQAALWDAVKLALAMSFKSTSWRPKFAQAKFQAIVFHELEAQLGADRVIKQARVQGASGHMIEFPMSVTRSDGQLIYIQPIALENGKLNWGTIYEAHGKLFDVKVASEIDNRLAIIEDGASKEEFGRAANFLGHAARIETLASRRSWAKVLA